MSTRHDASRVLRQRGGLLAVYKPADLPTEPTDRHADSLVAQLRRRRRGAPIAAASRLDVGVGGVVLCTATRRAARRVAVLRREGAIHRRYVALARGAAPEAGSWTWALRRGRDTAGRPRAIAGGDGARPARTDFVTIGLGAAAEPVSLLLLTLHTGRFHQIRAHAARAGLPLLGDRRYGGPTSLPRDGGQVVDLDRIALYAAYLGVGDELVARAPLPPPWAPWWPLLGGSPEAWTEVDRQLG